MQIDFESNYLELIGESENVSFTVLLKFASPSKLLPGGHSYERDVLYLAGPLTPITHHREKQNGLDSLCELNPIFSYTCVPERPVTPVCVCVPE